MTTRPFSIAREPGPASFALRDLAPLFADFELGRYCADWTMPKAGARAVEAKALLALVSRPNAVTFTARARDDASSVVGVLTAQKSDWDTKFWGIAYASIDQLHAIGETEEAREDIHVALLEAFDAWLAEEKMRFASARVFIHDLAAVHALERRGYRYIETTLVNCLDIRKESFALPEGYVIRAPREDETASLVAMTKDAFVTHRFYADPGFPRAKVDEMYEKWVESSLTSPAWTTIVLDRAGAAKGFFIYRIEDHREDLGVKLTKWRMGVLGGDDRAKGHGIPLFQGAMQYVKGNSDIVDSGLSLRNTKSFNLHTKLGFRGLTFSSTYHKWL